MMNVAVVGVAFIILLYRYGNSSTSIRYHQSEQLRVHPPKLGDAVAGSPAAAPAAATSQQLSGAWRSDERHTNNSHYDSSAPPPTSLTPLSSCLVQRNSTAPPRYQRK